MANTDEGAQTPQPREHEGQDAREEGDPVPDLIVPARDADKVQGGAVGPCFRPK